MADALHSTRGSSGPRRRFGDRDAVPCRRRPLVVRGPGRSSNAFARHLAGAGHRRRRPGRGDDREPGRVRRGGQRASASSAPPRCCSARPGRRWRSATPSRSPQPVHAVADGAGHRAPRPSVLGRRAGHRPRRRRGTRGRPRRRRPTPRPATAPSTADDEAVLVFSSGTTGLPKAVRHTHRSMGHATGHWCRGARASGPTTGSRWPPRRRTSSACSTCSPRPSAGATVRLHRRFDLDEVLRRDRVATA